MPSLERESHRIVIAGASSLLGAELKSLLEESKFAGWDLRLVDEEVAAGTLTEAGGEPAVIQPVEEGSFDRARVIFFTGSAEFTRANAAAARGAEAKVIDLSGALAEQPGTVAWFVGIDALRGEETPKNGTAFAVPSASATAASALSLGLAPLGWRRLMFVSFQPVSESGRAGIEELESQTSQLLSFQSIGRSVFDAQVAFSMLDRFGAGSAQKLVSVRNRVRAEVAACLAGKARLPTVQILHAPVFYGTTFVACAEVEPRVDGQRILKACRSAGFTVTEGGESPSNVSAAGERVMQLAIPEPAPEQLHTWWLWGAADNIRLPAWNAVKLAEKLA
jgi:aspartate-semialdehyde dehydrogenase